MNNKRKISRSDVIFRAMMNAAALSIAVPFVIAMVQLVLSGGLAIPVLAMSYILAGFLVAACLNPLAFAQEFEVAGDVEGNEAMETSTTSAGEDVTSAEKDNVLDGSTIALLHFGAVMTSILVSLAFPAITQLASALLLGSGYGPVGIGVVLMLSAVCSMSPLLFLSVPKKASVDPSVKVEVEKGADHSASSSPEYTANFSIHQQLTVVTFAVSKEVVAPADVAGANVEAKADTSLDASAKTPVELGVAVAEAFTPSVAPANALKDAASRVDKALLALTEVGDSVDAAEKGNNSGATPVPSC